MATRRQTKSEEWTTINPTEKVSMSSSLCDKLRDPNRPVFLFGSTPPREGTSEEKARETCQKFAARSAVLATDGFIVYDIQEEKGRTQIERPFPFKKTLDPAWYGHLFPELSGKDCIIYKCAVESDAGTFQNWLDDSVKKYNHTAYNLVGAPTSSLEFPGLKLEEACAITQATPDCAFGCVAIPERHLSKGTEADNMINKMRWGAEWFITQGIYNPEPITQLILDYGAKCREQNIAPKKLILSFAPCGRAKTMQFIHWLGMSVPEETEHRILNAPNPVQESIAILCDILKTILERTKDCGVPLGLNIESLSIFKDEIDGAHELFQKLQAILLNSRGIPWAMTWYEVPSLPVVIERCGSRNNMSGMISATSPRAILPGSASPSVLVGQQQAAVSGSADLGDVAIGGIEIA